MCYGLGCIHEDTWTGECKYRGTHYPCDEAIRKEEERMRIKDLLTQENKNVSNRRIARQVQSIAIAENHRLSRLRTTQRRGAPTAYLESGS